MSESKPEATLGELLDEIDKLPPQLPPGRVYPQWGPSILEPFAKLQHENNRLLAEITIHRSRVSGFCSVHPFGENPKCAICYGYIDHFKQGGDYKEIHNQMLSDLAEARAVARAATERADNRDRAREEVAVLYQQACAEIERMKAEPLLMELKGVLRALGEATTDRDKFKEYYEKTLDSCSEAYDKIDEVELELDKALELLVYFVDAESTFDAEIINNTKEFLKKHGLWHPCV